MLKTKHGAETLRALKKAVLKYRERVEGKLCDSHFTALLLYLAIKKNEKASDTKSGEQLLGLYDMAVSISAVPPLPKPTSNELKRTLPLLDSFFAEFKSNQTRTLAADAYQIWRTKERKEALSRIQAADKTINLEDLVAFTQIYTPDWVVNYLIDQTFSSQEKDDFTFLDPACGAGHFVLAAFDKMTGAKDSQSKAALKNRVDHILRYRLHGIDLDKEALFVLSIAIAAKLIDLDLSIDFKLPGLTLLNLEETDFLGSLSRNEKEHPALARRYDCILTNPPYIGRKLISRELKLALKEEYPEASTDLSAAFLERCLEMLCDKGYFGAITQASVLTLPTYRKLRKNILERYKLKLVADLGPGVFPNQAGEKIDSALIVAERTAADKEEKLTFFNLRKSRDKKADLEKGLHKSTVSLNTIADLYNHSFHQGIPESLVRFWKKTDKLENSASVKQGLATTDNSKFLRLIWQVESSDLEKRWYPYAKGAGSERWFSPILHVIDWQDEGKAIKEAVSRKYPYLKGKVAWVVKNEDYYFKPGLVFSFVNRSGLAVRKLPSGCIFDVGASAIFPESDEADFLLGYLNSSLPGSLLAAINPTINNQVGDLKRLPCPLAHSNQEERIHIAELARHCHNLKRTIYETASATALYLPDRHSPEPQGRQTYDSWRSRIEALDADLVKTERTINRAVFKLFSNSGAFNKTESDEVDNWLEERLTKQTDLSFNSFLSLFLTELLKTGDAIDQDSITEMESMIGKSLNSYIKSDLPLYIKRSFLGSPPKELTGDLGARLLSLVAARQNGGR